MQVQFQMLGSNIPNENKKFDLESRFVDFAVSAAIFSKGLPHDVVGLYYGDQLLRSGGSAALNFGEAEGTVSKKDYVYKATLCLKELKESRVNLKVVNKMLYGDKPKRGQLIKIVATIIKNKR